jgi:DnaD/phage-associated family protein
MQFSISSAADFFDCTERDITRGLDYWDKNNVIRLERNGSDIVGITILDLSSEPVKAPVRIANTTANVISINNLRAEASKAAEVSEEPVKASSLMSIPTLSRAAIDEALNTPDVSWLKNSVELYLQRPLSGDDQNLLVYLHDNLHFSNDLILHLYEMCIEKGKKDIRYIQSIALDWHSNGITTVEEADRQAMLYNAYYNAVNKAFNLGRLPGDKEKKIMHSWESMGFSPDMVKEACDRALLQCNKPSFTYADRILTSWNEENIKTPEALAEKDRTFNATKSAKRGRPSKGMSKSAENYLNRYSQREYSAEDMLEIERQMIEKSLGVSIKREG